MQAAVGVAQLKKLPQFIAARRNNWSLLNDGLQEFSDVLHLPVATPNAEPSWFGYAITVKDDAPFTRLDLIQHLESRHIGTRLLFGGNLVRQPAYQGIRYRIAGDLSGSNLITNGTFWIGVYPGLTDTMIDFVISTIQEFIGKQTKIGHR